MFLCNRFVVYAELNWGDYLCYWVFVVKLKQMQNRENGSLSRKWVKRLRLPETKRASGFGLTPEPTQTCTVSKPGHQLDGLHVHDLTSTCTGPQLEPIDSFWAYRLAVMLCLPRCVNERKVHQPSASSPQRWNVGRLKVRLSRNYTVMKG